jgi:DME family drug/metabolite transporter
LVLSAAVLWGTTGTAQALAPESATPASVGSIRLVLGGAALLAYALWRGAFRGGGSWRWQSTLAAALSIAAYQICFFAGVARTGVAIGTMVGIGTSPILAGVIGFIVRGERPVRQWGIATALAILGCSLLLASGGSIQVDPLGILLAVAAGGAYALFTVTSKGLMEGNPPEAVMAVTFCLGAVLLLPVLFSADLSWLAQPRGIAVALHLGLVTVGVAYSLFARGLSLVPVAVAATLTLAEPLTAGLLGVLVLGEPLNLMAGAGILLIFAGLAWLSIGSRGQMSVERSL